MMQPSVFLCYVACFLVAFNLGYNLYCFNNPSKEVQKQLNETNFKFSHDYCNTTEMNVIFPSSVAFWCLGGFFSTLICSKFFFDSQRLGCKRTIYIFSVISSIGLAVQLSTPYASFPWVLAIGRFISGFGDGVNYFTAEVILASVTPPSKRSAILTSFRSSFYFGILVSEILGSKYLLGGKDIFHFLFILPLLTNVSIVFALKKSYENPADLLSRNIDRAQWILAQFYEDEISEFEALTPILNSIALSRSLEDTSDTIRTPSNDRSCYEPSTRWVDFISFVTIAFIQEQIGVQALSFYSTDFLLQTNFSTEIVQIVNMGGYVLLLAISLGRVVSYYKTRESGITGVSIRFGCGGMLGSCVLLLVSFKVLSGQKSHLLSGVSVLMMFLFYSTGPCFLLELLKREQLAYIHKVRQILIANRCQWMSLYLTAQMYAVIEEAIRSYVILIFIGCQIYLMILWTHRIQLSRQRRRFTNIAINED